MHALTNMQIRGSKIQSVFGKHTSKDISLLQHGDDFVMLADENDLEWFAKQLNEALIVKVRGVLGGDRGDLKKITLLSRIVRYGQTMNGWPFLAWEADPRHLEIIFVRRSHQDAECTRHQEKHG